jgi:hypothetical protein
MSYREKIGWLTLAAMTITFGPYFALVATHAIPAVALPNVRQLILFGVTAVLQALILAAGSLYFHRSSPHESRIPPDERDRAIQQRSLGSAYYVLIGGMILVGCIMPFNSSGWSIINAALFMIVAAEVVHYGVVVFSYRRQS